MGFKFNNRLSSLFVKADLAKIRALGVYLQHRAVLNQKTIALKFDRVNKSCNYDNSILSLSKKSSFDFLDNAKGPPSKPQRIISRSITFKDETMFFYPDGTISSGTLYLSDYSKKYLYALSSAIGSVSYLRCYSYNRATQVWDPIKS